MSGPPRPSALARMPAAAAQAPSPGTERPAGRVAADAAEAVEETITLVEERLVVGKRDVERGGVRVRVLTDVEEAVARVALRSERIEVERVPVGRVVESALPVREEDGVTIIPVLEEVVVVETRLVLKEELHVRRVAETREHEETVLLRRQRAEVEELDPAGPAAPSNA